MWNFITKNWPMKLLALALAAIAWIWANSEVTRTTQLEVYFDVSYPDSVEVQVEPGDRRVMITVSGPTAVIEELSRRNVQVLYKLAGVENLRTDRVDQIRFDRAMVANLPAQAEVTSFTPETFQTTVRRRQTVRMKVNPPAVVGRPAAGYVAGAPEIFGLDCVTVTGPASVLSRIAAVDLEPLDVNNHSEPIKDRKLRVQTTIQLDNNTVERIQCDDLVDVSVDIRRANASSVIKDVPVSVLVAPDAALDVQITSENPVELQVEGPPELLKTLTAAQVHAFIDVRKRKPENDVPFFEKLLVQGLPEGVKLSKEIVVTAKFKTAAPRPAEAPAP